MSPSRRSATPVLLLTSAISFCAFYWLEVRQFIEEQAAFNDEIERLNKRSLKLVNFTIERLVGSLVAIILVAAILEFAEQNLFRAFLTANALFWTLDFLGNVEGNRLYKEHKDSYLAVRRHCPAHLVSYVRRFGTFFFWIDGAASGFIFAGLLLMDHYLNGSDFFRMAASVFIVGLTLFRHAAWRIRVYDWWKGIR